MSDTTGATTTTTTTVPVSAVGDAVPLGPPLSTLPGFSLPAAPIAPLAPAPAPLSVRLQNAGIPVAAVPTMTAMTNIASSVALDFPEIVAGLEQVNPGIADQLKGSWQTYAKSGAAPVVGMLVGAAAAHYGLACAPGTTTACWSPDFVNQVTLALIAVGTSAGALVMHWISKFPARKVLASTPVVVPAAPVVGG